MSSVISYYHSERKMNSLRVVLIDFFEHVKKETFKVFICGFILSTTASFRLAIKAQKRSSY